MNPVVWAIEACQNVFGEVSGVIVYTFGFAGLLLLLAAEIASAVIRAFS